MTDRELLAALTEFARSIGLMDETWKLAIVPDVPRDDALCLAVDKRLGRLRLLCTYGSDHPGACSWERATVGMSACTSHYAAPWGEVLCERPTHHAGEHKATGTDGVRWTWGDPTARSTLIMRGGTEGTVCGAREWGTNGHYMSCVLRVGHEGPHKGLDVDGKSVVTWPCPCYPDCTGHTETGGVDWRDTLLTTDSPELRCGARRASENPVMAGQVCNLLRGHVGPHMAVVNGQRWVFSTTDPTEPRAS